MIESLIARTAIVQLREKCCCLLFSKNYGKSVRAISWLIMQIKRTRINGFEGDWSMQKTKSKQSMAS